MLARPLGARRAPCFAARVALAGGGALQQRAANKPREAADGRRRRAGSCTGLRYAVRWPWQGSGLQPLAPKTSALSIRPQSLLTVGCVSVLCVERSWSLAKVAPQANPATRQQRQAQSPTLARVSAYTLPASLPLLCQALGAVCCAALRRSHAARHARCSLRFKYLRGGSTCAPNMAQRGARTRRPRQSREKRCAPHASRKAQK